MAVVFVHCTMVLLLGSGWLQIWNHQVPPEQGGQRLPVRLHNIESCVVQFDRLQPSWSGGCQTINLCKSANATCHIKFYISNPECDNSHIMHFLITWWAGWPKYKNDTVLGLMYMAEPYARSQYSAIQALSHSAYTEIFSSRANAENISVHTQCNRTFYKKNSVTFCIKKKNHYILVLHPLYSFSLHSDTKPGLGMNWQGLGIIRGMA